MKKSYKRSMTMRFRQLSASEKYQTASNKLYGKLSWFSMPRIDSYFTYIFAGNCWLSVSANPVETKATQPFKVAWLYQNNSLTACA